jgi:hypothetical protein
MAMALDDRQDPLLVDGRRGDRAHCRRSRCA